MSGRVSVCPEVASGAVCRAAGVVSAPGMPSGPGSVRQHLEGALAAGPLAPVKLPERRLPPTCACGHVAKPPRADGHPEDVEAGSGKSQPASTHVAPPCQPRPCPLVSALRELQPGQDASQRRALRPRHHLPQHKAGLAPSKLMGNAEHPRLSVLQSERVGTAPATWGALRPSLLWRPPCSLPWAGSSRWHVQKIPSRVPV